MSLNIAYHRGGVHLKDLALWLDSHEPVVGPEKVFVSHAHSDHIEAHREVILSAPTARLMKARLSGRPLEHILPYQETTEFQSPGGPYKLTLLPAGHIFGSAMALLESDVSLLYTGDFKLRSGRSAEPCAPRPAEILIMETTFGRPEYQFPPTVEVLAGINRFCRETLNNDETPVLLGYSLGKSQELLCGLAEAGLPLMLHDSVYQSTLIYEQFGQCFPAYERFDAAAAPGKVLICPPGFQRASTCGSVGPTRTAILTGWAVDERCRYRYQTDAAFPLSDHADFQDLIRLVEQVAPRRVLTLHGFAADFAQTLREMGYAAAALSEDDQQQLPLNIGPSRRRVASLKVPTPGSIDETESPGPSQGFGQFARTCSALAATSSKLEKVSILADYLRVLRAPDLGWVVTWFTGMPFASTEAKVLHLGWSLLRKALCTVGDVTEPEFLQVYLQYSDLGEAACDILQRKPAPARSPSLSSVARWFQALLAVRGPTEKLPLLVAFLQQCGPLEVKFLIKVITSDLRIGLKEGLVEEGIAKAFAVSAEEVRQANLLLGHIGETAELASRGKLADADLVPFRPVKLMLASPEVSAVAIWERMQNRRTTSQPWVWVEDKYDGIRCQLHRVGDRAALYSRDLKDITGSFSELARAALAFRADLILDGEIVGMKNGETLPFADLQKRLGRREDDLFLSVEVPVSFIVFDILWENGRNLLALPLRVRRRSLEALLPMPDAFRLADVSRVRSPAGLESAFSAARTRQNEGLLIKDPASPYSPGRRGLAWLKWKKALATLDCVVVGAEYGHGKRSQVLSDYTFAVRDETTGELRTIGKAYSGLTDAEIAGLTKHFLSRAISQRGRFFQVRPDTVLEVAFDRVQVSARHSSGLALRFPRIVRIRTDKAVTDIDTVARAKKLLPET